MTARTAGRVRRALHEARGPAAEALRGTHLYGRRLTIERAAEDDDVAGVREKTAARFDAGAAGEAAARGENAMKKPRR